MDQQNNIIPIPPGVQTLLRQWIKEKEALEAQISGVLQSLVVGRPGTWDLDETLAFMKQSEVASAATGV